MTSPADATGVPRLASRIRSLAASVLDLAQTRAQLLGTDVELQFARLRNLTLLAFGAALLFTLALAFLSLLVVAAYWDTHRLAALALVTIVHLMAALGCLFGARKLLSDAPRPFAATIDELRRDIAQLRR